MFVVAQSPPPPPIEERRVPPPPTVAPPAVPDDWAFPRGLSVVAGLNNPEWAHVGVGYRYRQFGGGLSLGSIGLAHNVGAVVRFFHSRAPGGPFLEAGATAVQLAETTPGLTPRDIFFQRFLGAGWQFEWSHVLINVGAGLHDAPARSTAPPAPIISSGLMPRLNLEVGYAF
ncbi:MAG: hypothetical protein FJZ01_13570 [Candidatus Sericytochromatia bacterium]|nr:hypothetical protein [Candidatus Tanganyikabacteria bacterium]